MNWKNKLQELGMTEEELSVRLKKVVKDYYTMVSGLEEANAEIQKNISERKRKELEETIESLEEAIEAADEQLTNEIVKYHKNKDAYAIKAANLRKGKENKAAAAPAAPKPAQTQPKVVSGGQVNPAPAPAATGGNEPTKKKGSGWLVAAGIIVGVLTLGAVVLKKD